MGSEYIINSDSALAQALAGLCEKYKEKRFLKLKVTDGQRNSWPMKKTWRMWMSQTATWMAGNGVKMPLAIKADGYPWGERPFNADDAHELFVKTWIGVDANGERYKTASGDKGVMLHMMDRHLEWALDRGVQLTIPESGEYSRLKQQQTT